jgi:hypothetical protein
VGLKILVNDQQRNGGHIKQISVVGVGGDHATLNGAFHQAHDQQAIHGRQVAFDEL